MEKARAQKLLKASPFFCFKLSCYFSFKATKKHQLQLTDIGYVMHVIIFPFAELKMRAKKWIRDCEQERVISTRKANSLSVVEWHIEGIKCHFVDKGERNTKHVEIKSFFFVWEEGDIVNGWQTYVWSNLFDKATFTIEREIHKRLIRVGFDGWTSFDD